MLIPLSDYFIAYSLEYVKDGLIADSFWGNNWDQIDSLIAEWKAGMKKEIEQEEKGE